MNEQWHREIRARLESAKELLAMGRAQRAADEIRLALEQCDALGERDADRHERAGQRHGATDPT